MLNERYMNVLGKIQVKMLLQHLSQTKHESMMKFSPLKSLQAFLLIFLVCGLDLFSISLSYYVTFEVFAHLALSKPNAYL